MSRPAKGSSHHHQGDPPGLFERRTLEDLVPCLGLQLQAWLMAPADGLDKVRQGPTFTLWFDGSDWRASLHDRLSMVVSYLRGETLVELLEKIDHELRAGVLRWRKSYLAE